MIRCIVLVALAATLVVAAGCDSGSHVASTRAQRKLADLNDISHLRMAFNAASDEPRLVVLVSPT